MTSIAQSAPTAVAAAASSGQAAALIVVSLSTAKSHNHAGERISLTVKITNVSGQDLLLPVGRIELHSHPLRLDITDSMGNPVRKHESDENSRNGLVMPDEAPPMNDRRYVLKAGDSQTYVADLTDLYGELKPGSYKVRTHSFKRKGREWTTSNELTLVVD